MTILSTEERLFEVRRRKARMIARRLGGQKELAAALKRDPSQVSSIIGRNPRDNIGSKLARMIEKVGGESQGWLDIDESADLAREKGLDDVELVTDILAAICVEAGRRKLIICGDELTPRKVALLIHNGLLNRDRFGEDRQGDVGQYIGGMMELLSS